MNSTNSNNMNNMNITYEDYDWMGVLNTLDVDFNHNDNTHNDDDDGCVNNFYQSVAAIGGVCDVNESGRDKLLQSNNHHNLMSQNDNDNGVVAQELGGQDCKSSSNNNEKETSSFTSTNDEQQQQPPSSTTLKNHTNSNNNKEDEEDTDAKLKQSRIERKRSREKQRRLDTNSQFNALADIVREIETIDLVDEMQYNLLMYGVASVNVPDTNNNAMGKEKEEFIVIIVMEGVLLLGERIIWLVKVWMEECLHWHN